MPGTHALLSPSSAYRWLVCTPSARFEEQIPEQNSTFAAEGTLAHDLAALVLSVRAGIFKGSQARFNRLMRDLEQKIDAYYEAKGEPTEYYGMLDHAEDWAEYVKELGGDIQVEQKIDMSTYVPMCDGTADATNEHPDILYVNDLKYGAGIRVTAVNNQQTMLYGLGALLRAQGKGLKPKTVVLNIFQPRAGGWSTWGISTKDLIAWAEDVVRPAALQAVGGLGEFVAGDHCRFCKAQNMCKARFDEFSDLLHIHDKRIMSTRDIATVLTHGSGIATWVKKVEAEALAKLQGGKSVPGFKLVAGRSRRSFTNEDGVVEALLASNFDSYEIYDPKLRSLTDFEKHLGKTRFNAILGEYVQKIEGNNIIAPVHDDRPAVGASGADEYDDENDLL